MASKSRGRGVISELTHIAPIKQGIVAGKNITYADRMRTMLGVFHDRETQGFPGVIRLFRGIHTSQWTMLDGDTRLMLNVIFDGDLRGYLRALTRDVSGLLTLVWSNCEGWESTYNNPQALIDFIERFQVRNNFFYAQHPSLTVPDVESLMSLRDAYQALPADAPLHELQKQLYADSTPKALVERTHEAIDKYEKKREAREAFKLLLATLYDDQEAARALDETFRDGAFPPALVPPEPKREELIQALVLKPFERAHCARVLFYSFSSPDVARAWVRELRGKISCYGSESAKLAPYLTVGFTHAGLEALGVDGALLSEFPAAFVEGMAARKLGDPELAASRPWTKVIDAAAPIHAVVCVHTEPAQDSELYNALLDAGAAARQGAQTQHPGNDADMKSNAQKLLQLLADHLAPIVSEQKLADTKECIGYQDLHMPLVADERTNLAYGVEYFGFRDGIAQPRTPVDLAGAPREQTSFDAVLVPDGRRLLKNASFLVMRQLRQDTDRFWKAMGTQANHVNVGRQALAEEIVGRRMDGRRLDRAPDAIFDPIQDRDAFDSGGDRRCPLHAHVRRTNPRTELDHGHNPRLMRRSMAYSREGACGLMFMAFNADIETQFELIQRHWTQAGNQVGLSSAERDVLTGLGNQPAHFYAELPGVADAKAQTLSFVESFVTLEWGVYLYIPAREALDSL